MGWTRTPRTPAPARERAHGSRPARRRRDGVILGRAPPGRTDHADARAPSEGARPVDADAPLGDDDTTPVVKARSGAANAAGVSSDAPPRPDSSFVRAETPKRSAAERGLGREGRRPSRRRRRWRRRARERRARATATPSAASRRRSTSRPPAVALASATRLWPEARKLYGHVDDVSCVAAQPFRRAGGVRVRGFRARRPRPRSGSGTQVRTGARSCKLAGATLTVVALHFASPARAATPAAAAGSPGFSRRFLRVGRRGSSGARAPERALLAASRVLSSPSTCPRSPP